MEDSGGEQIIRRPNLTAEERRAALMVGHRRNPFTTKLGGGRILSAMMLPGFLLAPPAGFGVIETIGRRTGKRRRKCVRAIRRGDRVYLVSIPGPEAAWLKNIRAHPRVRLRLRGGWFAGRASELGDEAELREAFDAYCGRVNSFDRGEYVMHRRGRPTSARIRELHRTWFEVGTPVVVEIGP